MSTPEAQTREQIDRMPAAAVCAVQDAARVNLDAGRGIAIGEFPLRSGCGFAGYLPYVDGGAAGVIEAKKQGTTLTGVEVQAAKYSEGLRDGLPACVRPLPFCYQSTGVETRFTNGLDPDARSRPVSWFHRLDAPAARIADLAVRDPLLHRFGEPRIYKGRSTFRGRVRHMPPPATEGLWPPQVTAIQNLDRSFAEDHPRALIRMAAGSGKTSAAVSAVYRLS